jgi:hypothetical protein
MILGKYTIYDAALEGYNQDWTMHNDGIAIREFTDMCNSDTKIAKNPEDYSLWKIGSFDNVTGELIPQDLECLAKAHEQVYTTDK